MLFGFPIKTQHLFVKIGICSNLSAVKVEFFTPNKPCGLTKFNDFLEEFLKGLQAVTIKDFSQIAVIGNFFIQVIANVPAIPQIELESSIRCLSERIPSKNIINWSLLI
jgi:hypothetical protein